MKELVLVGGTLALAFVSAFVPVVSIEAALLLAAATAPSEEILIAQVVAAAAGQMAGKSCFFLGGRLAGERWSRGEHRRGRERLRRLVAGAGRRRDLAAATVFLSALTGLPPFAVVSALAGTWRLRLPSFVALGLAGRLGRFGAVLLVPSVQPW